MMDDRHKAGKRLSLTSFTETGTPVRRGNLLIDMPPFIPDPDLQIPAPIPRGRSHCGELAIRIDREGVWYYQGSLIPRKELVRLFASVLTRDLSGDYWLVTPAEMGRVQVDDAPFLAVGMTSEGAGRHQTLHFRTNVDDEIAAGPDNPIRVDIHPQTGEPSPYVTVKPRMEARIARPVYYDLVSLGTIERVDNEPVFGIWSGGAFFILGRLDEDDEEITA